MSPVELTWIEFIKWVVSGTGVAAFTTDVTAVVTAMVLCKFEVIINGKMEVTVVVTKEFLSCSEFACFCCRGARDGFIDVLFLFAGGAGSKSQLRPILFWG
ncbi:hypothetical protein HK096_008479, partial [Nowakowskiella sp. JEL0078]